MENRKKLLEVKNLKKYYPVRTGFVKKTALKAVDDVSFSLENGKIFVIVGESGSGKTTLLRTVGGLLSDEGKIVSGNIFLQEKNLVHLSEKEWQNIHGGQIGYIFQNPEQSLSPLAKIEKQFLECARVNKSKKAQADLLCLRGKDKKVKKFHILCTEANMSGKYF